MKPPDLENEAAERLEAALREVPFLKAAQIRKSSATGDSGMDFVLAPPIDRRLLCQVKSSGQPRIARDACLALLDATRSGKRDYPVLIAPYLSPAARAICDQYDVGYFDLAGNCRLSFDQIYIRREGFPNSSAQKRDLRSLYSPKAERVLRVLLAAGKRNWRTQNLANEARVSLGQVANVKKLLAGREWIESEATGFRLGSLDGAVLPLLKEWSGNYRRKPSTAIDYYSMKPIPQMEAELAEASRQSKVQLAFSGFSGAARFAPAVRYQRITAYFFGDLPQLTGRLGLKPVSSGSNVTILEPYDEGVFYGAKEIEGAPIVSPVQLYLDLMQIKGRGEEAASAILDEVIQPLWR